MSLDYPFYEELCRRKHRAAWWWLIGDRFYYLGLLPALFALPATGLALLAGAFGFGWHWSRLAALAFVAGVIVFVIGGALKQRAYTLAERDGISAAEVYSRGAGQ